jgi:hypothetical protein
MRQMVQSGTFEKFEPSDGPANSTAVPRPLIMSGFTHKNGFDSHSICFSSPKHQIGFVRHISDNYYLYSNKPRTSTEALSYFNGSKDSAP